MIADRIAATGAFTLTLPEHQGTGGFTGQGNENLEAEQSDSWTLGAVFDPTSASRRFTLSVDYFKIEIEDLIDTVDRQIALNSCFDPPANSQTSSAGSWFVTWTGRRSGSAS